MGTCVGTTLERKITRHIITYSYLVPRYTNRLLLQIKYSQLALCFRYGQQIFEVGEVCLQIIFTNALNIILLYYYYYSLRLSLYVVIQSCTNTKTISPISILPFINWLPYIVKYMNFNKYRANAVFCHYNSHFFENVKYMKTKNLFQNVM